MGAGRVITGFSKPYVAKLSEGIGGIYTYNYGMLIARGVNVSITPDTGDDNNFHADNVQTETGKNSFTGGELTLIVDGNWLLMSRLSVLNNRFADEYELNQELKLMLIKSINKVLRFFPFIDNIIFVADGGSWRNQVPMPECRKREETSGVIVDYKGTRVKSTDINWDLLF